MYNRYIRSDGGTYTRISAEDAPLPPPEPQRSPHPPQRPTAPLSRPAVLHRLRRSGDFSTACWRSCTCRILMRETSFC